MVCLLLQRLVIPASVTEIDVHAFDMCKVRQLEIEEGSVSFKVQDQFLVDFTGHSILWVVGSPESIRIPFSVHCLTPYCCAWKTTLITVEFEPISHLWVIDEFAFFGCESLRSICIPSSVKLLPAKAFRGCASLERVSFPSKSSLIPAKRMDFTRDLPSELRPLRDWAAGAGQ
jgi:hypothetical protein